MASAKLYLDLRSKAKDGKRPIVVVLNNNQTNTSIGTGVRVYPDEWNGRKIIKHLDAALLNAKISCR